MVDVHRVRISPKNAKNRAESQTKRPLPGREAVGGHGVGRRLHHRSCVVADDCPVATGPHNAFDFGFTLDLPALDPSLDPAVIGDSCTGDRDQDKEQPKQGLSHGSDWFVVVLIQNHYLQKLRHTCLPVSGFAI
jgi:hypothetical protein